MCVCAVSVIVKRPVLPPCVVDGRSRNPLYYYYYMLILTIKIPEISSYCEWPLTGFISVCALIYCTGCLRSLGRRAREWAEFLSLLVSLVEMPSVQTLTGNCSSFTLVFAHCTTRTSCFFFFSVNNTDRLVNFCQNWYVKMWWRCHGEKKQKKKKKAQDVDIVQTLHSQDLHGALYFHCSCLF